MLVTFDVVDHGELSIEERVAKVLGEELRLLAIGGRGETTQHPGAARELADEIEQRLVEQREHPVDVDAYRADALSHALATAPIAVGPGITALAEAVDAVRFSH
jgi:hypothetical protein